MIITLDWLSSGFLYSTPPNGVGSDLPAKRDAGLSMNFRSTVIRFRERAGVFTVVGLPMHIVNDLPQRKQFLQSGLSFVPARGLERCKGLGWDLWKPRLPPDGC